jgi:hypothetical protein
MDEQRARHACMGYITRDGRPVRFSLNFFFAFCTKNLPINVEFHMHKVTKD